VAGLRKRAAEFGRHASDILVFVSFMVVTAPTEREAQEKYAEYKRYWSPEGGLVHLASSTGIDFAKYGLDDPVPLGPSQRMQSLVDSMKQAPDPWTVRKLLGNKTLGYQNSPIVGSADRVADEMIRWVDEADVDGFNLHRVITPGSYIDFVDLVVPQLQSRGRFKREYEGGTMREKFFGAGRARLPANHIGAHHRVAGGGA
jgi:alkanesulfonate monooxygenase SsuD/methylene tetrahydromethanopterin reductase-like flavin-dependent oxidoreductase (luciferase family)